MLKLKFSGEAERDLQSAAKYYNRQKAGLGRRFKESVNSMFLKI